MIKTKPQIYKQLKPQQTLLTPLSPQQVQHRKPRTRHIGKPTTHSPSVRVLTKPRSIFGSRTATIAGSGVQSRPTTTLRHPLKQHGRRVIPKKNGPTLVVKGTSAFDRAAKSKSKVIF